MDFTGIIQELLGEFKLLEDIRESIKRDRKVTISDLSFCAKSIIASVIAKAYPESKVLLLTPSSIEAQRLWRNLDTMLGRGMVYNIENIILGKQFPEVELNSVFAKEMNQVFVSSLQNCYRELISKSDFNSSRIFLKTGEEYNIYETLSLLVKNGYLLEKKVSAAGSFSRRGDVLDVFSPNYPFPVRVEFDGNKIEKMYYFDSLYQTLIDKVGEAEIVPLSGNSEMGALFSWFDGADPLLIIDGAEAVFTEMFNAFSQRQALGALARIEQNIKNFIQVNLETFAKSNSIRLGWIGFPRVPDFNSLVSDLKHYSEGKYNVVISTASPDSLIKELSQEGLSARRSSDVLSLNGDQGGIIIDDLKIIDGMRAEDVKLVIISDFQLVGEAEITKSEKSDFLKNLEGLLALSESDYVVHIDHGIGQFEKIDKIKVSEIEREYIFLKFAGEDRLYVPVEQADKITKYISVTKDAPELSRLGGETWKGIREQAKKTTWVLAKDLLEIQALRETKKGFAFGGDDEEQRLLASTFVYKETADQAKAIHEVLTDMSQPKPMDRLVCADVGYGKTEVAVRAAVRAVTSGRQVALLAPTTILVEQHEETFRSRLVGLPIKVESISRFKTTAAQQDILAALAAGEVDVIIGTHRLLSRDVKFKNLGLVIIDEEHKFGVRHKEKLKQYRSEVDVLALTATPIPRTLHMALSGLRDISTINTAPQGRLPIKTMISPYEDKLIKDVIEKELDRNGQVYFVHNRVQTIEAAAEKIRALVPQARIVVAHGQMKTKELAQIMSDFEQSKYNILVSSTIIESGLDIASVNTLIVDRATHFGLAQLHQLRGRIGRGSVQAYAYFLYKPKEMVGNARQRLEALREATELGAGMSLAVQDLNIRGAGNILGQEQHGAMNAVGIGYYLKLLSDAIEEIRTGIAKKEIETTIDLPVSAYIPDSYINDRNSKLRVYQKLAGVDGLDSLSREKTELYKKYGFLPMEVANLFLLIELKILANLAEIKSIKAKEISSVSGRAKVKLIIDTDQVISQDKINKIQSISSSWFFGNMQLKVDLDQLGSDWLQKIFEVVRILGSTG